MTKTVFVDGAVVPPEFLNAINNPIFVESPQYDGEIEKLNNSALSDVPGNIKPEWFAFRDEFKISAGIGLNVVCSGGRVTLPNGAIVTIAAEIAALTDNATNLVFINSAGVLRVGATLDLFCLPIASITTVGGQISGAIADLRPRYRILPKINAIRVFGGSGDEGDYTLNTGSATLGNGEYYFRDFTIGAAATITIPQGATLNISGNCTIAGTINVSTAIPGGAGVATNTAGSWSQPGAGIGRGGLQNDVSGTYGIVVSKIGSSGGSGQLLIPSSGVGNAGGTGGAGGGYLEINCAGTINISGSVLCRGGVGSLGTVGTGTGILISGAGGGSGGAIILRSLSSVVISGTLDVRGGNGGNASLNGQGGGGGGGGVIALTSPSINTTGSNLLLAGGSFGATQGSPSATAGCGGSFGGAGGVAATAGATGLLIARSFIPVG